MVLLYTQQTRFLKQLDIFQKSVGTQDNGKLQQTAPTSGTTSPLFRTIHGRYFIAHTYI
jgi:hypothetical protein